jgi:hypothetical protein
MIKDVGLSRIIFILVLLGLNAAFLSAAHFHFVPKEELKSREVGMVKGATRTKYAEIVQLREDFALLKDRLTSFSALELSGFFESQNRVGAERDIDSFRERAKLLKVNMSMEGGEVIEEPSAAAAGHVLLESPFSVKIDAQDDADVMYFVKLMQKKFPGVVKFENITMKRIRDLDAPLLRLIGSGTPAALVEAEIKMKWITMPSKEDVE